MFGTFLLVLAGAGAAVVGAATHGHIGRAASVVAPALMVATAGLWASPISGASMSPARSLGPREGCWSQVSPRRRPPHCVRSRRAARRDRTQCGGRLLGLTWLQQPSRGPSERAGLMEAPLIGLAQRPAVATIRAGATTE